MRRHSRIDTEKEIVQAMITLYCKKNHGSAPGLCPECQELLTYAHKRLGSCKFGEDKPTCAKCTVHCYKPDMRERIKNVMRFSGPRMLYIHPLIAVRHLWDGRGRRDK